MPLDDSNASAVPEKRAEASHPGAEWWRSAVIYQIYPRSFADSTGNGIGDLPGITARLSSLAALGVDAIWLSPFYPSPQKDAGYDVANYRDVDPIFGTLDDFDELVSAAHRLGLKVIADVVPNHSSDQHVWFQEALASPEGSPERERYMFRDGGGPNGENPPNNWQSVFGGSMWERVTRPDGSPGQWYLHIFDVSQPDLNWQNPWVRDQFHDVLRFWLDRGVDGFRVDVAHGMIKKAGLPDYTPPQEGASMGGSHVAQDNDDPPYWGQPEVHEIWRGWNAVLAEYGGDRLLAAEAWVDPLAELALWVRPDEFSQAFNFEYLQTAWDAASLRHVIEDSIGAFGTVGAPSTWVLSNHDVVRHATRLALGADVPQGSGIGPLTPGKPDAAMALRRGRAATCLMLALPGSAYIYQGEELGLPEDMELPDEARQDPTWFRTDHEKYGRDGCRVPLPWEAAAPSYGFGPGDASWLPQPDSWAEFARDAQEGVESSTLELYRSALALRRYHSLGTGSVEWRDQAEESVLTFTNGAITVVTNLGTTAVDLPAGEVLLSSEPLDDNALLPDTTVWMRAAE